MNKIRNILGWAGIVILGLFNGLLEDLLFLNIIVPYMPPSWDLTGNLFFIFTVPLAQLLTLGITGTLAWFFLGLHQIPRLITFWICWSISRAVVLTLFNNPVEDIVIYLVWIALWCVLIGLLARSKGNRHRNAGTNAV
ncbi:MAG: hypothetical protein NXH95_04185 [Pseudomonadaceae bacterium]|nr:hypothetical protein [Pseudomonadaceae bacterium]